MDDYEGAGWDFDSDYLSQPSTDWACRQCGHDLIDMGHQDGEDWVTVIMCTRCDEDAVAPRMAFLRSLPEHIEPANYDDVIPA